MKLRDKREKERIKKDRLRKNRKKSLENRKTK